MDLRGEANSSDREQQRTVVRKAKRQGVGNETSPKNAPYNSNIVDITEEFENEITEIHLRTTDNNDTSQRSGTNKTD